MMRTFTILNINVVIFVGLLFFIQAGNIHSGFADSVTLIKIHSGNKTLDHDLPKFYNCIDKSVRHSIKEQKDPYFKTEPTKNEVITCYYDVLVKEDTGKEAKGK